MNREIERRWYLFYFFLSCEWRSTVRWSHCLCFKFHISWTHIQIIVFLSRIWYGRQLLFSHLKRNLVINILGFWRLWSECTLIRVNRCHRNSCLMHFYDDYFKKLTINLITKQTQSYFKKWNKFSSMLSLSSIYKNSFFFWLKYFGSYYIL